MSSPNNHQNSQTICPACVSSSIHNRPDHTHTKGCLYTDKAAYDEFMEGAAKQPDSQAEDDKYPFETELWNLVDSTGFPSVEVNYYRLCEFAERLAARRAVEELKRVASHNNSEYTSDYLEDRIATLTGEAE